LLSQLKQFNYSGKNVCEQWKEQWLEVYFATIQYGIGDASLSTNITSG